MRWLLIGLCMATLGGCATSSYSPPTVSSVAANKYTVVIEKPYDETWSSLINHAASTFFAIDQFEKDSGLMTLSFGSSDPGKFINCGTWSSPQYVGEYVSFLARMHGGSLSGKMNILVRAITDDQSEVRVNARYIFTASSNTWAFDTGGSASASVGSQAAYGTDTSIRTCKPTYEAENSILEAMKK